ncbi:hypothetical protein EKO23_09975 [Nocardioides guangzhouensis]|uniref:DUF4386 family protein n=1 Tax=Nocardioides guangzhouensis TaxID=2497878 RepID=A0A4Q4ZFS4_9ACTN|nr:hypothetical protein [Nocardioides guangzhouensis]RYP86271.1 hypothetical protein EKO23_09975 [Nocardioides guangzhouensis]
MTVTQAPAAPVQHAPGTTATKVAAGAAALLAVSLFMTVAVINVPHDPSDQELLAWWQDSGNRWSGVLSGAWALGVAVTVPVILNHLHRMDAAARSPQWLSFARSMGGAVTAVWLVTGAARGTLGHLVDTMDEPLPGVDVLRFSTALNYTLLGQFGMAVLALCMLAVSVVVLRTGAFGRWLGYVGAACSAVMMAAVLAQVGAIAEPVAILWALCVAVAIWRQPVIDAS